MAVVQLSEIQLSTGNKIDLPVSLKQSVIGVTKDTGELFIGFPNLPKIQYRRPGASTVDGIFPYSNIKILTEYDVSYTLTDDVYFHGPLQKFTVTNTTTTQSYTYTGSTISTGTVTLSSFFSTVQTNAIISSVTVNSTKISNYSIIITDTDAIIDLDIANITLSSGNNISIIYYPIFDFYQSYLSESDSMVLQYSTTSVIGYPTVSISAPQSPRRIGTLMIVADQYTAALRDDYVDMNVNTVSDLNIVFNARIVDISGEKKVYLSVSNGSSENMNITINGNYWASF